MIEAVKQYIALTEQKRALAADLRNVQEQLDSLEPTILDEMTQQGVSRISADGHTAYMRCQTWARPIPGHTIDAVHALEALGLTNCIATNAQSLSALFREKGDDLPEEFRNMFELTDRVSLNIRKE